MHALIEKVRSTLSTKGLEPEQIQLKHLAPAILCERVLQSTVSLVNVAFLSRVSDQLVSAVSISTQYIQICQTIATAVATGTIVCINQAIGMHNQDRVERMSNVAVFANMALGLLFGMFFLLFSEPFLSIMQISEASLHSAATYMRIVGGAMVMQCLQLVMGNICRSLGMANVPLIINLFVNCLNIIGCALVVFQPIPISCDPAIGVGAANVFSQGCGLILASCMLHRAGIRISPKILRPFPWSDLKLALSIGIPGGITNVAYGSSQLVTTSIITMTGEINVAAKVYVSNIVHYVALIGMACGQAAVIMIGYRIGAGKYDEVMSIRKRVTRIALTSNIICSLLLMLLRYRLLAMFTDNEAILTIASTIMVMDLFVEIGRALNNTLSGALQATGDVLFQMIVNQASSWLVSVGLSYLFGVVMGYGLYGVWVAFAMDEFTRGLILLYRWRSQKWMKKAEKNRKTVAGCA